MAHAAVMWIDRIAERNPHLSIDVKHVHQLGQRILVLLRSKQAAFDGAAASLLQQAPQGPRLLLIVPKAEMAAIGQHIQVLVLQDNQSMSESCYSRAGPAHGMSRPLQLKYAKLGNFEVQVCCSP